MTFGPPQTVVGCPQCGGAPGLEVSPGDLLESCLLQLGIGQSSLTPGVTAHQRPPTSPAKSGEDVVEGDRLEVAAADDIEQLAETVGDGGQVGVANHDLLGLK